MNNQCNSSLPSQTSMYKINQDNKKTEWKALIEYELKTGTTDIC